MTPYQQAALAHPCLAAEDFNRAEVIGATTHWERGFRVTVIVDAVDTSAGVAEQWPAWHVNVTLVGELTAASRKEKGHAHPARPLGNWGALRERGALFIVRRELADVGYADTERIVDKAQALRNWTTWCISHAEARSQPPVAVYGRRKLTMEEAEACFATQRHVLARLNPTYAMLNPVESP